MQPRTANDHVGSNVAALRGEMSQSDLAAALAKKLGKEKIDPTTITRLESGKRPITVNELVALADILKVDITTLLQRPQGGGQRDIDKVAEVLARYEKLREARIAVDDARKTYKGARGVMILASRNVDLGQLRQWERVEIEFLQSETVEDALLSDYAPPPF